MGQGAVGNMDSVAPLYVNWLWNGYTPYYPPPLTGAPTVTLEEEGVTVTTVIVW